MKLLNFIVISICYLCCAMHSFGADRPNIILFLVDDMGLMDCSVPMLADQQGQARRYPLNDFYRTPNLEKLAARGIRFSNFHAMSVCSPTRISLMTGQNAARHQTTNWINPDQNNRGDLGPLNWNWQGLGGESITLARLLQTSGYRTIHVGKGHFGPRHSVGEDPSNLGFDVNVAGASFGSPGSYYAEMKYGKDTARNHSAVPHLEEHILDGLFLTDALTVEANRQVEKAVADGKPFFLHFAHYAVHSPFETDQRFLSNYQNAAVSEKAKAFATLIEGMDKSLGDLMSRLEQLGVADQTIIFFLGDNGSDSPLGEAHDVGSSAPLRGKKGSHYEGGTRTAFVAAWTQRNAAIQCQQELPIPTAALQTQLAVVYDLFPTILEMAKVKMPAEHSIDGFNLHRLLLNQQDPNRPAQFLMHYPHAPHRSDYFTSWQDGGWKIIYHYFPDSDAGQSRFQLFNLIQDPFEQVDLSAAEPEVLRRMFGGLVNSVQAHGAQMPVTNEGGEISLIPPN